MLKIVRRNKAQIDKLLFKIKQEIIKEGKKMALEYAMNSIPTEQQVVQKLQDLSKENPKEAKEYYDTTTKLLEGIKLKLENSLTKIDFIRSDLNSVNSKMETIKTISSAITPLINYLEALIISQDFIVIAPGGPGSNPLSPPGPIAAAATRKEKLKGKVKKMFSSIQLAVRTVIIITITYFRLKRKVDEAHTKVAQLIDYIEGLLTTLEQLFGDYLSSLLEDQDNISVLDNLEDLYINNPGLEGYLDSDDSNLSFEDEEDTTTNTIDGISNIAPRFYKQYRTGSTENPNTEE